MPHTRTVYACAKLLAERRAATQALDHALQLTGLWYRDLACVAAGAPGIWGLSADTDGVDGAEEIAGAHVTPDTLARAWAAGVNPRASLDANDAHSFFSGLGDSVVTGPTRTNVNDFRALLIA